MQSFKDFVYFYRRVLNPETNFFVTSVVYGVATSILMLAIPISVQALVNTIAFGVLVQPLVILSFILLLLLIFSGVLKALQTYIVEIFQRHFFVRFSTDIAKNLMFSSKDHLTKRYGVELVNRYFDIMTVQKKSTTLFTGGVALLLQLGIGLLLLAFYHPYFLVFDVIFIASLCSVWWLFGKHAMTSAVKESTEKYKVAYWLEEVARVNTFFKNNRYKEKVFSKSNKMVEDYIIARRRHFRNLFVQIIFLLFIYAFLSALLLGLGGYLVIVGELTLGQLVAAELIVTVSLTGVAGAGKYLEDFYDLFAALSKLNSFYDLEFERNADAPATRLPHFDIQFKIGEDEITLKTGGNYLFQSKYYSSKLSLVDLICGNDERYLDTTTMGGKSYLDLSPFDINTHITVIKEPHFFKGTIFENLTFGLEQADLSHVKAALNVVELNDFYKELPQGLDTEINPNGYPLYPSQLIRLTIAREILLGTKILVFVDILDSLEIHRLEKILKDLVASDRTIVILSNVDFSDHKFDEYFYLKKNEIVNCKTGKILTEMRNSDE